MKSNWLCGSLAEMPLAGEAGAAQMVQTFASLAAAARMDLDWRMRVLGDQLGDVKKAMDGLRRKLPER